MAKSSNTWCKKLMAKQAKYAQRHARARFVKTFEQQNQKPNVPDNSREFLAPVKAGYVAKGFGKKSRNGSRLNPAIRQMVEARAAKRAEFFAGLGNAQ